MKDWNTAEYVDVYGVDPWKGKFIKRFASVDDAIRYIGYKEINRFRGHYFSVARDDTRRQWVTGWNSDAYEVRDDLGFRVDVNYLKARAEIIAPRVEKMWRDRAGKHTFRDGPVPGVHKRHWHRRGRHKPSLIQEYRENEFIKYDEDLCEYKIKYRDIYPNDIWEYDSGTGWYDHNWKRYRKTQWKEKSFH